MHWLSNNLAKEPQLKTSQKRRERAQAEEEEEEDRAPEDRVRSSIPAESMDDMDNYLESLLSIGEDYDLAATLKDSRRSLESGSSSEQEGSLKKVSFAKHSLRYTADKRSPEKVSESDTTSSIYYKKYVEGRAENVKPLLQTRRFTSPPPPRSLSPTPILKSLPVPISPDSTSCSIGLEESRSQCPDKRDPLLLSEWEMVPPLKHDSPSSLSPEISDSSIMIGSDGINVQSNAELQPECYSTPEIESSLPTSFISDYYTPFDSFHDSLFDKYSSMCEASLRRSTSAPSFMICAYSEGQDTHCLTDDSTIEDFKAYLLNISDFTSIPEVQDLPQSDNEDEGEMYIVDSYSLSPQKDMMRESSSGDDSRSPGEVEAEETETESSPRCGYRDIALSELLDRIYPAVNTSLKSSEDSMSPSPKHDNHFKFAGLVLHDGFSTAVPSVSTIERSSHSVTTCSTEKTDLTVTSPTHKVHTELEKEEALEEFCALENSSQESTADNVPSTLMLLESDEELDSVDDHSSITSICQTYSVHDSDNSMFTIPSLPLECMSSSPQTTSVSAVSTPASVTGTSGMEDTSGKETIDTSSEIPSTGSNDENFEFSFCPKQGSSSDYYSECLSQPNANLINNSAGISMITIPSLPLGGLASRSSMDGSSLNTNGDSTSAVPFFPLEDDTSDDKDSSRAAKAQTVSESTIKSSCLSSTENNSDIARNVRITSTDTVSSGLASPVAGERDSPKVASPVFGREKSITVTIPSDLLKDGTGTTKSEPTLTAACLSDKSIESSSLSVPPLPYNSDTYPYQSISKDFANVSPSEAATSSNASIPPKIMGRTIDSTGSNNTSTDTLSNKQASENQPPSLSLKIMAWSSDRDTTTENLHKIASSPAKLSSDTEKSASKPRNTVAITVMEPPKLICEGSCNSGSSAEDKNGDPASSRFNASLKYVTELLESSHDSLVKAVQTLSQKAVIKQSNISLELILPLMDLHRMDKDGKDVSVKIESHLAKLQLNSSTFYTTEDNEATQNEDDFVK